MAHIFILRTIIFRVMILSLEPGDSCAMKHPGVPAILLVVEGAGTVEGQVLRPGRVFYWAVPEGASSSAANTPTRNFFIPGGADEAGGAIESSDSFASTGASRLTFSVDASKRGPLKVAIAHQNLHTHQPTAFNRSESSNSLLTHGGLPYMGISPSPMGGKKSYQTVMEGTPSIPTL
jgi:hypothetical protein